MEELGNIRWFIKDNEMSASLMNWYVQLDVSRKGMIPLEIYSDGQRLLILKFNTLEETIGFVNSVVNKAWDIQEIKDSYSELYDVISEEQEETGEMFLTPSEVDQALLKYFGEGKDYKVSLVENVEIVNGRIDINFYLIEHLYNNGIKETNHIRLTRGDLRNALSAHAQDAGFELVDFVYVGGIHRVGYFIDEDTPHYDGIHLDVKKKNKRLELKRKDANE